MTSLGVSMFNWSVVGLERSLVYSTDDFTITHQVIPSYASAIWSPHMKKDKFVLENVQKFACRMATKSWNSGYEDLLDLVDLHSHDTGVSKT